MSRRILNSGRTLALSAASLLLLAGCWTTTTSTGESSTNPDAQPSTPAASAPAASSPTPACPPGSPDATSYECVGVTVTGAKGAEPTITLAADFAPAQALQVADVYDGSGVPVAATDTLTVHYVGMGQQSKEVFDSSWTNGQPSTFPLNGVIAGWQGLVGMMPGGRRLLVIPGSLAYGPEGRPPVIAADETLVFVVDLISATPA